jgi:signal transduction histidine kinase/ActR/RegA family two-component response regulator
VKNKKLKKSISSQYLRIMALFSVVLLTGFILFVVYNGKIQAEFEENDDHLEMKAESVMQLEHVYTSIILNMRGYFAFGDEAMKDKALAEKEKVTEIIQSLNKTADSREDTQFLSDLRTFHNNYFEVLVPKQLELYEATGEQTSQSQGLKQNNAKQIEEFRDTIFTYHKRIDGQIRQNFIDYTFKEDQLQWFTFIFVAFLILLLFTLIRSRLKTIGGPLQKLALASETIATGREVEFPQYDHRDDEVGMLSRSFEKMIKSIQENEQNLLAQNEELIAQQDELQMQKEELENAVHIIQTNETSLQRRNELMHSLSNSLNKQTVLEGVVENICLIMNADRGIIVLMDSLDDHAAFGLAEAEKDQFMRHLHSGMVTRLIEKKRAYSLKRNCTPLEKGYHTEALYCYDLYVPVLSSTDQVAAVMMFSRYSNPYSKDEIKEYEGVSKQISISLEKIRVYEESEFDRLLTKDILDTIHEGVQLVDEEGVVSRVNIKMQDLYQSDKIADMANIPLDQWSHKVSPFIADGELFIDFMQAVMAGETTPGERHVYHMNGPASRVIQVYAEELYRGNKRFGTLLVHRDITQAYEVDQMKSEFVSTVSHELRTPLSSVLGFTELMLNKTLKPERQQKYLQTIYQEAKRLTALINDFLDVQRMESGRQTYEKKYVDIIPIINRSLDTVRDNHKDHTFALQQSTKNTTVLGDEDKITQVLNNLLSNAVKYSPNGGEVKVTVYEKGDNLAIDVTDQGLGIPNDALENIFTKFYRVDNSDRRKIGGTGLGLSIVSEIMKAHEGSVSVASELKKGSTFILRFPLVPSNNTEVEKADEDDSLDSIIHNVNVIVIEDDRNLASLLQTELEDNGFQVLQYTNGEDAISAIEQYKPDTIVLDIMLDESRMNGWEILEEVKKNPDLKDIPIIVSSALEEKEKGFSLGATEYLVKPYPPHKLSSTILQTLLKKEKRGQILVPGSAE